MDANTKKAYDKVELIPWDPVDEKQFQRMYDQRVACGWRHDEVEGWKEKMLNGQKFLYWIVGSDSASCETGWLILRARSRLRVYRIGRSC